MLNGDDLRRLMLGDAPAPGRKKLGWSARAVAKLTSATGTTAIPSVVRAATKTWMPLGDSIVIVGGDLVGLELAEFLAHRGRRVTIIDDAAKFGRGLQVVRRWRIMDELRNAGVNFVPSVRNIRIDKNAVRAESVEGADLEWQADNVLIAKGADGDSRLAEALRAGRFAPHVIGDAGGIGFIEGAMRSAASVARIL